MDVVDYNLLKNSITHSYIKSNVFDLLPFSEQSQLISKDQKGKFLNLLHSIVSIVRMGLITFQEGHFNKFDAQVGENLCQMRAYYITFLAQKYLCLESKKSLFQSKIDLLSDYQKIIEDTIKQWNNKVQCTSKYDKDLDSIESAKEFMKRKELFIELNEDITYLAACYFLAHFSTKINGILQSISLTQIAEELFVSKSQAKKIVQKLQNTICKLGFDFICQSLDNLPLLNHYKKLLPDLLKDSGDARLVLPCFAVSEIIFQHALYTQIPIFLSVSRIGDYLSSQEVIYCLLIGDHFGNSILADYEEHWSDPCVVIEAEVNYGKARSVESAKEYTKRLLLNNPVRYLLANTAMHPQYAGLPLQHLADDPYLMISNSLDKKQAEKSFNLMKEFAKDVGCHKNNASTLFMKHAYSSIIKNQIDGLQQNFDIVYDVNKMINQSSHSAYLEMVHFPFREQQTT